MDKAVNEAVTRILWELHRVANQFPQPSQRMKLYADVCHQAGVTFLEESRTHLAMIESAFPAGAVESRK